MKLIRYEYPQFPAGRSLNRFFDLDFPGFGRFGSLFDEVFGDGGPGEPGAHLFEDKENYYARLELPGMKKDQINVELENAVLTVSGDRTEKTEGREESFRFTRSVSVPDEVSLEKIRANYEDGVLTVTMPKEESRKPKQIAVK
jgi:HSP20 family protein